MVGHILWELFDWPSGIVVGNLIASFMWAAPTLIHLQRRINKADNSDLVSHLIGRVEALHDKVGNDGINAGQDRPDAH